ncbi:MAG TPA: HlyD family efflux transporter periplasmic adaptor subunit [Bacillota bacterium]|jgi:putative membrane fusion protein|nr:hypothetical protein [Bacillota bacterium]HOB87698.1 HlyD family efflux transporter periplasmic adaptor subunit [Bacillota bacterium]HOP69140.1 HlyD family efflux transporter periplasmic adaptor subunit [Bacillota bacterium]HPT33804.1 HlyD family efflux transporter periplasmic adaptor subunit [Bacillota bacterium]HPZ65310.1 HlyD family efflux transporter periplasmic adaptor subunit [Bacillota bacterium]
MSERRRRAAGRGDLKVLPGQGRRESLWKQSLAYHILLALAAVIVVLFACQWLGRALLAYRLDMVVAQYGVMEERLEIEGLVTRSEQVYTAPYSGVVVEMAEGGERVPLGAPLVEIAVLPDEEVRKSKKVEEEKEESFWEKIWGALQRLRGGREEEEEASPNPAGMVEGGTGETVTVNSLSAGLLSYQLDDWDGDGFAYLSREEADRITNKEPLQRGALVEKGEPLLKIVDNWSWYFSFVLPLSPGRTVAAQKQLTFYFAFAPERPLTGEQVEAAVDPEEEAVRLTYRLGTQVQGFEEQRWAEAAISYQPQEGIIIPEQAITRKEEETGVLVNQGGVVFFNPVQVLRRRNGEALVEGLPAYSLVITRPELVREGQRLW